MKSKRQIHPILFFVLLAVSLEVIFLAVSVTTVLLVASDQKGAFIFVLLVLSIKAPLAGALVSALIDRSLALKVMGRLVGMTNGAIIGGIIGTQLQNPIMAIGAFILCALVAAYGGQWLIARLRTALEEVITIRAGKSSSA